MGWDGIKIFYELIFYKEHEKGTDFKACILNDKILNYIFLFKTYLSTQT